MVHTGQNFKCVEAIRDGYTLNSHLKEKKGSNRMLTEEADEITDPLTNFFY